MEHKVDKTHFEDPTPSLKYSSPILLLFEQLLHLQSVHGKLANTQTISILMCHIVHMNLNMKTIQSWMIVVVIIKDRYDVNNV